MRFIARAILNLLIVSLFSVASFSGDLPLNWENIYTKNYGARQAAISPDGKYVAVTASFENKRGIYLVTTDQTSAPVFWTSGSNPVWFADSQAIIFSRSGDLWRINVEEGSSSRITNDPDLNERAASPSPDGKTIAFYSGRSGYQDIWLTAADGTGTPSQLTKNSMAIDDFRFAPAWSPDNSKIAYFSNKSDYWEDDIWIVDLESHEERQLSKSFMVTSRPVWSPDGKSIAVLGTAKAGYWYEDLADIYILDPDSGAERIVQMQINATDMLHNHAPVWSGNGEDLYFPYQERAETELWRVPAKGGVATRVTNMGGAFFSYDATADGSAFIFLRSTSTRGNEVDYMTAIGGATRALTDFSTKWQGLIDPEEISYRSYDGLFIQSFIFYPPNFDAAKKYPTLVMVHGGGTNSYYKRLSLNEQHLAQKGYVVLAVNYRGGSGFGRVFQDLSINDWGNGQAKDAAAAADFIRSQTWSNGKVGIYGYSYGGITSMAAISRVPDAFDAAVPMAGIYNFADAYENADRIGKIFIRTGHGGAPEDRPEIYAISNALSRVHQVKTPLLIMHGEADVRAPYRQFELAVDILKSEGKEFASKSFAGEPHGFRNPANRIELYSRLEAWFDKYLK